MRRNIIDRYLTDRGKFVGLMITMCMLAVIVYMWVFHA